MPAHSKHTATDRKTGTHRSSSQKAPTWSSSRTPARACLSVAKGARPAVRPPQPEPYHSTPPEQPKVGAACENPRQGRTDSAPSRGCQGCDVRALRHRARWAVGRIRRNVLVQLAAGWWAALFGRQLLLGERIPLRSARARVAALAPLRVGQKLGRPTLVAVVVQGRMRMVHLPLPRDRVAVHLEHPEQRCPVRPCARVAERIPERVHLGGVRAAPRKKAIPRGATHCLLNVGSLEQQRVRRERVEMRSARCADSSISAELRAQVLRSEQQRGSSWG